MYTTPVDPSVVGGDLCPMLSPYPSPFDLELILIFAVIPIVLAIIFFIVLLFKKKKVQFIKKFFGNIIFIVLFILFAFFFPKHYRKIRPLDAKTTMVCQCFGWKAEQVAYRTTMCSKTRDCLGIPYACKQAKEQCHSEYGVGKEKFVCDDPHLD
ncbi:MAG: hypothetical protein NTV98_00455 [Candidatus Roizmanbacteria bacterium]|nr:hypothetical protein [Candidatus Roizmanbacteria bacterium]